MGCKSSKDRDNEVNVSTSKWKQNTSQFKEKQSFKVVCLGKEAVGKTSMTVRFCSGTFTEELPTVGASYYTKSYILPNSNSIKIEIWDTAGLERYRALAPMYYRNSDAAILVYDITNLESFNVLKIWHSEILNNVPDCLVFVVGNKLDLDGDLREVDQKMVEEYTKEHNLISFEASSKTGKNINEIFSEIGMTLVTKFAKE